jgi:hypothetical protein
MQSRKWALFGYSSKINVQVASSLLSSRPISDLSGSARISLEGYGDCPVSSRLFGGLVDMLRPAQLILDRIWTQQVVIYRSTDYCEVCIFYLVMSIIRAYLNVKRSRQPGLGIRNSSLR